MLPENQGLMAVGEWRKWMVLVATIWIQASTGTNLDFPSYSTQLKSVLGITQVKLNYLSMASDFGKVFGWCSGVVLLYLPTWVVLFMAAFLGLIGYGLQWLLIQRLVSLPYIMAFILCLSAGCSISWFNTVCFVLCIKNFPSNQPLAVSLSVSFNGASAALYNLIATNINSEKNSTSYLLLNAFLPLITSILALAPILQQPSSHEDLQNDNSHTENDTYTFMYLYILASATGLYLLFLDASSQNMLIVAIFFGVLPLISPGVVYALKLAHQAVYSKVVNVEAPRYVMVKVNNYELHEELIQESEVTISSPNSCNVWVFDILGRDQLMVLGEEHTARMLVTRYDFWLYYIAYFCGGTIGLIYSNNLGQICQSLGYGSETTTLVTLYSTCSFFGRLISAAPDLVNCFQLPLMTRYTTRTGWLALSLVPMPIGFLLLILSSTETTLSVATGLIGLSSGFIFSAAVTITAELFGSNSAGVNHNILITNIPLGSLLYGLLAALVYDNEIKNSENVVLVGGSKVCMGRKCYFKTFEWWGFVSLVGVVSSFLLFLRTRKAYLGNYQKTRNLNQFSDDEDLLIDGH